MGNKIGPIYKSPVSSSIPYDDSVQGPPSGTDDVQEMLDYLKNLQAIGVTPGFSWGRSGNVNQNTWLLNDSVPSNLSGRTVFLSGATVVRIFVANEDPIAGIVIEFYTHDGDSVSLTLLGSVTTAATRSNSFTVSLAVGFNKQIAVKVASSSSAGKNLVVGCILKGNLV